MRETGKMIMVELIEEFTSDHSILWLWFLVYLLQVGYFICIISLNPPACQEVDYILILYLYFTDEYWGQNS